MPGVDLRTLAGAVLSGAPSERWSMLRAVTISAEGRLAALMEPEQERLDRRLARATAEREPLLAADADRRQWLAVHPIAERRLDRIRADLDTLDVVKARPGDSDTTERTEASGWLGNVRERTADAWQMLRASEAERECLLDRAAEQTLQRDSRDRALTGSAPTAPAYGEGFEATGDEAPEAGAGEYSRS
jgi:hypothetical protein